MASSLATRRAFLLGAGATLLAAGCARPPAAGHSPGHGHGHGHESAASDESGSLTSRYMKGPVRWRMTMPAGPVDGALVCLHGYGGDHQWAFNLGIPAVAAAVGLRVAVAGVDGGRDSYWHRRADGTDSQAMLLREFVPMVRRRVGAAPLGLMGWSMGGYGALLAAEVARGKFVAVAPASPALWLAPADTAPGAFDSSQDFYANDVYTGVARLRGLAVAVACGTGDPFYDATRALVADMRFPHDAWYGAGGHDAAFWRAAAPVQLRAVAGSFKRSPPTA